MITYHEIRDVLRKMALLDTQINHLKLALNKVSQVSKEIDLVSGDLATDRERFDGEIKSVEVLEKILQKHVYGAPDRTPVNPNSPPRESPGHGETELNQFRPPNSFSWMATE